MLLLDIREYEGESSKLNQCIEIIQDAVLGGHKILLFSSYTSMFEIIEEKLKNIGVKYLKLTGQTKVAIRFRGRQLAHVDLGKKVIDDFVEECAEVGQIEKPAKLEGRTLTAILAPKKKK